MRRTWRETFYKTATTDNCQIITGVLNPIHWDRNGKIRKFSIYSEDEEDIIIEGYLNKQKLESLLSKRVLGKGKIRVNKNCEKFIRLRSIKEIAGPPPSALGQQKSTLPSLWDEEYSLKIPAQYTSNKESFWEAC